MRGCGPGPAKFSLSEGGLRLSGPNYPPCLWGRLLRFSKPLVAAPAETSVRDGWEGSQQRERRPLRRSSPLRPPVRRGHRSDRAARHAEHFPRLFVRAKRVRRLGGRSLSGGPLQTEGAPLIGEARREIHESCYAITAWEGPCASGVDQRWVEERQRQRHANGT
jgi:hypothetical protein